MNSLEKLMRTFGTLAIVSLLVVLPATPARADQTFSAYGPRAYGKGSSSETFSVADPSLSYTIRIRSTASSGSVLVNGAPVVTNRDLSGKSAVIEQPIALAGTNRIDVQINGNPSSSLIVEIIGLDAIPPTVTITSPEPSASLTASPVTVTGTVSDAQSGIADVTCSGLPATIAAGTFSCSIPAADGNTSVLVEARDAAGNVGVAVRAFTVTTPSFTAQVWTDMEAVWRSTFPRGAYYKPVRLPAGFWSLGDYGQGGSQLNGFTLIVQAIKPGVLAAPVDYEKVWDNTYEEPANSEGSFWKPIPPVNFTCLGLVVQPNRTAKPDPDRIRCVRTDLIAAGKPGARVCCGTGSVTFSFPSPILDFFLGSWQVIPADDEGMYVGAFTGGSEECSTAPQTQYCLFTPTADHLYTLKRSSLAVPHVTDAEVQHLIQTHGPIVYLHSQEQFLPEDPAYILDRSRLAFGIVHNEDDFDTFAQSGVQSVNTSDATLMQDVEIAKTSPLAGDPDFKDWVVLPRPPGSITEILCSGSGGGVVVIPETCGSLDRTKALVRVLPIGGVFLDIQYWFYYAFNGPGRFRVCAGDICFSEYLKTNGRHFSDWEHVTERFAKNAVSGQWELVSTFMSRHTGGEWQWVNNNSVSFEGTHPVFYSAYYSHAFYRTAGTQYYLRAKSVDFVLGTFAIDLFDLTNNGTRFDASQPGHSTIISSGFPGVSLQEPNWLPYKGRWGQYEPLKTCFVIDLEFVTGELYCQSEVGAGPTGPSAKGAFTQGDKPDLWEFPQ